MCYAIIPDTYSAKDQITVCHCKNKYVYAKHSVVMKPYQNFAVTLESAEKQSP